MTTEKITSVISKAVHEAVNRMSPAEVRELVVSPYIDIRNGIR